MQPLPSSVTSSVLLRRSASSMPTEPNSLTMSAVPSPSGVSRNFRTSVVLPEPRNPVTMVTGNRVPRSRFWRRPNLVPVLDGKRSKIVSMLMMGLLSRPRTKFAKQKGRPEAALRILFRCWIRNPSPGSTGRRCGGRPCRPPRARRRTRR